MNRNIYIIFLVLFSLVLASCNLPGGVQSSDEAADNRSGPGDAPDEAALQAEPSDTAPAPAEEETPTPTDTATPNVPAGPPTSAIYLETEFDTGAGWNSFAWWRSDVHTFAGANFKAKIAAYVSEIQNGTYYFEVPKKYTNITAVYGASSNLSDVRIVADTILTLDRPWTFISILCRYEVNVGWYEFYIKSNSKWGIAKISYVSETLNEVKELASGASSAINYGVHGALNRLAATCQGDTLTFQVNGVTLGSAKDASFAAGVFGVGVAAGEQGNSIAAFDRMRVTAP